MDCKNFEEFGSLYIDRMLTEEEMKQFKTHLENCEECTVKLKNLQLIVESINEIDEVELPDNFTASLREKLESIEQKPQTPKNKWLNWKTYGVIAAGLVLTVTTVSLLNQNNFGMMKSADMAEGTPAEYAMEQENGRSFAGVSELKPTVTSMPPSTENVALSFSKQMDTAFTESVETEEMATMDVATDSRKLIEQGRIKFETNKFDEVYEMVMDLVAENNGYVQRSESYYRMINREKPEESLKAAYLSIRVPNDSFKKVFNELKSYGVVISENMNTQDVTVGYRDMENEYKNLEVQEERLREILQKAEKVEDILRIENELNRVRTQINSIKSALRNYDQLVALSTIDLEIEETKDLGVKLLSVNEGIWGKAKTSFIRSINQLIFYGETLFIKLFGFIPVLLVLGLVGVPTGLLIYNKVWKRRK